MTALGQKILHRAMPLAGLVERYPRVASCVFGLLAATGFPPLALWPVALLAMAGFSWLVFSAPGWKEAGKRGWLFGVAHFTLANNWIAQAFTYQESMPTELGWFAVPLLALYLAVYPALAAIGARLIVRNGGFAPLILALAGSWSIAEWLRGWVFTGFAWDPLGLVLLGGFERPGIALMLPWMGTYALSGFVILLAGCLLWLFRSGRVLPSAGLAGLIAMAMY
ncbi:MAG: apolipoprotein N-acyltransferase, partial [Erythrobacter sp. 34-65-8]